MTPVLWVTVIFSTDLLHKQNLGHFSGCERTADCKPWWMLPSSGRRELRVSLVILQTNKIQKSFTTVAAVYKSIWSCEYCSCTTDLHEGTNMQMMMIVSYSRVQKWLRYCLRFVRKLIYTVVLHNVFWIGFTFPKVTAEQLWGRRPHVGQRDGGRGSGINREKKMFVWESVWRIKKYWRK